MANFYLRLALASALVCVGASAARAQVFMGYHSSNYAGLNAVATNPAHIVDSRYKVDINLFALDFRLTNNYLGLSTDLFRIRNSPFADTSYNGRFQAFRTDFFRERNYEDMRQARLYQSAHILGPSVAFSVGKNTFALTTAVREFFFFDNLQPETADFILDELLDQSTWNIDLDNERFNAVGAIWSEVGLVYGREVLNKKEHYLKAAVHPKATIAAASAYFYSDRLMLNFTNNDTLNVELANIRFGYSNNLQDSPIVAKPYLQTLMNRASFALDFGAVYEWRPKYAEYVDSTGSDKAFRHVNKYKLRLALSVTDIGWLKFDRGTFGGNFDGDAVDWDLNSIDIDGVESFGQLMRDTFNMSTNRDPYRLRLPTAFNVQADYNLYKNFYVNFTGNIAFHQNNAREKTHVLNYWCVTPRFESKWLDFALPFAIDGYGNFESGGSLRVGPLFIGSTNAFNFLLGNRVRGLNVYTGLRVGIPYSKPKKPKEVHVEPVKIDTPAVVDTPKVDTPKVDTPKVDTPKVDTPKVDTPKVDTPKVDTPKVDTPKVDTPKVDTPKVDTPKVDTPKVDTPKVDAPKDDKTVVYQGHRFKYQPFEFAFADNAVYFASGTSSLTSAEKQKLDSLVTLLDKIPNWQLAVHGFTDNVGSDKTNSRLAQTRAEAVKKYLVSKGVPAERIFTNAFGTQKPVGDNASEEGRKLNRRVEVFLLLEEKIKVPND